MEEKAQHKVHTWRRLLICYRQYLTTNMQKFLEDPDKYISNPIKYFKNHANDTSTVALIKIDAKLLVVKRYNIKSFFHRIKLWLRESRAMVSWQNVHLLKKYTIPTVNPVAILEKRIGPLRGVAYFIYEYVEGTMCCDYFEKNTSLTDFFKTALTSCANLLKTMQSAYIYHGDCHHNNMIMDNKNEVILLDLDHMKQYRYFKHRFKKNHQKDLEKFVRYLGDNRAAIEFFEECMINYTFFSKGVVHNCCHPALVARSGLVENETRPRNMNAG